MREWQTACWDELAERASEAHRQGHLEELFTMYRELWGGGTAKSNDGCTTTVENLEIKREAWAKQLQKQI